MGIRVAALTTFVPRLGGPRCDANVTWTSTGGLAENGRRGYTGAVRKFNYGDSIPLEAERAVKTTIGRCECIGRGFRAARIQGLLLLTPRSLPSLRGFRFPKRTDHDPCVSRKRKSRRKVCASYALIHAYRNTPVSCPFVKYSAPQLLLSIQYHQSEDTWPVCEFHRDKYEFLIPATISDFISPPLFSFSRPRPRTWRSVLLVLDF